MNNFSLGRTLESFAMSFRNFSGTFYEVFFAITFGLVLAVWSVFTSVAQTMGVGIGGQIAIPNILIRISVSLSINSRHDLKRADSTTNTVRDTREFNKVSYSGSIKTRQVEDIAKKVISLIHVSGGKVDSNSASQNYAYISFVVPKSNFETFESDVSALVDAKLYTKYVSGMNLLSQKQYIEANQKDNATQITDIQKQKTGLTTSHTKTISNFNSYLSQAKKGLAATNASLAVATDTNEIFDLYIENKFFGHYYKL